VKTLADLLAASLWTRTLTPAQRERVEAETFARDVAAGAHVCRRGDPVDHWIGIVDGLVKMSSVSPEGKTTTFLGVARGGWFGEGSLLKDRTLKYDIVALRATRLAFMPKSTFDWLLETDLAFNRFLLAQLNERLAQFIAMVETQRLLEPDARVARSLAALFNPVLYPEMGLQVQISQEEIGYLAGVSRQRVNQALQVLEAGGLIRIEYGGLRVLDVEGLRAFG
jgi:CRP/FNR family transcriptional regulator, cyclic AMP receptor protein